jgi:glucosamine 6-phosphate synthetase-like amidotransferase/phosphosugar isomerase protein
MCGIIAFTGSLDVIPILLEGLRRTPVVRVRTNDG